MTMTSGAVFIDNEDDSVQSSSGTDQTADEILNDAAEDAVMKQVVMATQRKNELMMSVKKLHIDNPDEVTANTGNEGDEDPAESNIKPSMLRRLSRASQILHFENIANMKKRRSQTDSDMQKESTIMEEGDAELEFADDSTVPPEFNKVAELGEVFTRRSKKHIRDYARRRTLDDDPFKHGGGSFGEIGIEINIDEEEHSKLSQPPSSVITEVPERAPLLELASKTEKFLPHSKPQYPRFRRYGRLSSASATWKSLDNDRENAMECDDTYFGSFAALNLEIQGLNRVYEDGNTTTLTVDLTSTPTDETTITGGVGDEDDEFCVADLVHFHDKIIREKILKRSTSVPPTELEADETAVRLKGKEGEVQQDKKSRRETSSKAFRVQRVQSFPKMKRFDLLNTKKESTDQKKEEIELADVRSILVTFETKKGSEVEMLTRSESKQRSSSLEITKDAATCCASSVDDSRKRASTDVDLRSVDET